MLNASAIYLYLGDISKIDRILQVYGNATKNTLKNIQKKILLRKWTAKHAFYAKIEAFREQMA